MWRLPVGATNTRELDFAAHGAAESSRETEKGGPMRTHFATMALIAAVALFGCTEEADDASDLTPSGESEAADEEVTAPADDEAQAARPESGEVVSGTSQAEVLQRLRGLRDELRNASEDDLRSEQWVEGFATRADQALEGFDPDSLSAEAQADLGAQAEQILAPVRDRIDRLNQTVGSESGQSTESSAGACCTQCRLFRQRCCCGNQRPLGFCVGIWLCPSGVGQPCNGVGRC